MSLENLQQLHNRGVVKPGMCIPAAYDGVSRNNVSLEMYRWIYSHFLKRDGLNKDQVAEIYQALDVHLGIYPVHMGWTRVSGWSIRSLVERRITKALSEGHRVVGDFLADMDHLVGLVKGSGKKPTVDLVGIELVANPFSYTKSDITNVRIQDIDLGLMVHALCSGGEYYRIF